MKTTKPNFAKYAGMFSCEITATIEDLSSQTQNYFFFRIPKNQNNFETLHCGV